GVSTSYTVTMSAANGFSNTVDLTVSGLPGGANGTFAPTSVSPGPVSASSTVTVTTSASTAAGTYTLTVSGTDGTLTRTTTLNLIVQPAPSLTAPASVVSGSSVTVAWANVSGPTRNNWIGLYQQGATDDVYLGGFYDDSCGQSPG